MWQDLGCAAAKADQGQSRKALWGGSPTPAALSFFLPCMPCLGTITWGAEQRKGASVMFKKNLSWKNGPAETLLSSRDAVNSFLLIPNMQTGK